MMVFRRYHFCVWDLFCVGASFFCSPWKKRQNVGLEPTMFLSRIQILTEILTYTSVWQVAYAFLIVICWFSCIFRFNCVLNTGTLALPATGDVTVSDSLTESARRWHRVTATSTDPLPLPLATAGRSTLLQWCKLWINNKTIIRFLCLWINNKTIIRFFLNLGPILVYSKSHFKSVTFVLHVFRSLCKQFSSDFHEIWQELVSSLTAPALKISGKNIMSFKS